MITDKSGAATEVTPGPGEFSIAVEGRTVGHACIADRDNQRVFYHTEVDDEFGGRGLGTILIEQALAATSDEGMRIVAVCPMVAKVLDKHSDLSGIVDPVTPELKQWAQTLPRG